MPSRRQAVGELLCAAVIWGLAFTAVKWSLLSIGPLWTNTLRFGLALIVALPFIYAHREFRQGATWDQLKLSMAPGALLGVTLALQSWGLRYTTVTKSGFITVLYIIFVPVLEALWLGRRGLLRHSLFVLLAIVGIWLICKPDTGDWNIGDVLTLLAAMISAGHIISLDLAGPRVTSSFVFNLCQTFWAGVVTLLLAPPLETIPRLPFPARVWGALAILSLGATLFAFLIQVRSQRVLPASLVSMIFVLETPFAALFAYLAFRETLSVSQWAGALTILVAAVLATYHHLR